MMKGRNLLFIYKKFGKNLQGACLLFGHIF